MANNNESKLNTTPLKATAKSDKQKFLQTGTIEHIDVTKNAGIVPVVEAMHFLQESFVRKFNALVPLPEQDRSLWDAEAIAEALAVKTQMQKRA